MFLASVVIRERRLQIYKKSSVIESFAILSLRGVSTKLKLYFIRNANLQRTYIDFPYID